MPKECGTAAEPGRGANLDKHKPGGSKAFRFGTRPRKGQIAWFGLNAHGNDLFDSTAFDVTVTPVAGSAG